MKPIAPRSTAIVVALAGVLLATTALADPPSRVARLNYVKGSVSFRPATLDDWGPATLNHPLTTGDHLWTDGDAWTEMHVGSTAIRMAPRTAFAFLNLDDRLVQVRLSEGAVDVRLRHLDGDFEINTPSAAIVLNRPGTYRVEVQPDEGSTRVVVRAGEALVYADESPFSIYDGQAAALYGTDQVAHEIYSAGPADEWEQWCRARDAREDRVASLQYVSPGMTGYEDLDEYGTWTSVPEYGWAWQPRYVSAGWAPYRHGHWRWVEPWGWTWIDDAPWGFAPFHYGRWAHHRRGWLWVPGAYHAHPVYSPALVAFIGGDRWGVSLGFGFRNALAWFPLAPGEFWMPHYRASHGHIRNLNITHVNVRNINITNYDVSRGTYVNRAIAGAVTAVPRDTFIGGRAVPRSAFAVERTAAMRSEVIATSAPVAPRAESVLPRSGGSVARPTGAALRRAVVARNQPPGPQVPFQARERALQANAGRPLDENTLAGLRGTPGARASESNSPVRLAGARASRRGDLAGGRADTGSTAGNVTPRAASPGDRGAGVAVPRGGERAQTGEPNARPGSSASAPAAQPQLNDRPAWARPRGGNAATSPGSYGSGAPDRGGQATAPAGARTRSGEAPRSAAPATRGTGVGSDRPATASPGAAGRATGNDRPSPAGAAAGRAGTPAPGSAVGGARSRGAGIGGTTRPPAAAPAQPGSGPAGTRPRSGGQGQVQSAPDARPTSPSRPPGDSGARPRSGGEVRQMDRSSMPSSRVRPQGNYEVSRPATRSAPLPPRGSYEGRPRGGYETARPPSSAPQVRSTPQSRPSAPSAPRPSGQRGGSVSRPSFGGSAPPRPSRGGAVSRPSFGGAAPSRPSGGGAVSRPSFGGSAPSRPSGGGAVSRPSGGGAAPSRPSGGGAVSRPSGGQRGGGGAAPSGGGGRPSGARQRSKG